MQKLIYAIGSFSPKKIWYGFSPRLPSKETRLEILPSYNAPWVRMDNGDELPMEDLIGWTVYPY